MTSIKNWDYSLCRLDKNPYHAKLQLKRASIGNAWISSYNHSVIQKVRYSNQKKLFPGINCEVRDDKNYSALCNPWQLFMHTLFSCGGYKVD